MNLFDWLIVGHLVGDFLLQNRWMADSKTTEWLPLLIHSTIYTMTVAFLAWGAGGLSWGAITWIWVSHVILDQRTVVNIWTKKITKAHDINWLVSMTDQTFHVLILAIATLL